MGDAQSAQRDDEKDAEAEEESGTVEDAPTIEHNIQDKVSAYYSPPLIHCVDILQITPLLHHVDTQTYLY